MLRGKRWEIAAADPARAEGLARAFGLPLPVARVLAARGFACGDAAERFLHPRLSDLSDPFALPDMEAAVARTWAGIESGERIAVFGDYDADGVTGTAVLVSVLRRLGADAVPFLPNRMQDGYGLTRSALERCLTEVRPGLIVTVDCGTGAAEPVAAAARRGVDVIVTDHHEPGRTAPPAVAVVNPNAGGAEDSRVLAGAGVAFKMCHALVKRGLDAASKRAGGLDLRDWLDVVAVGTVADVAPLTGENRILVRHGLNRLARTKWPGLRALKRAAGLKGSLDCYHLGFVIGPRINAPGRLGRAESALELLLVPENRPERAEELAKELENANRERKSIEGAILEEAARELDRTFDPQTCYGVSAAREGWHVGTIGIVAARLCSRYYRPAAVIGLEESGYGRGSLRSIEELDLMEVLEACADLLESFGGHRLAAGIVLDRERVDEFRKRFNSLCAERLRGRDLRPVQRVAAPLGLGSLDRSFFEAVNRLRPFGIGNPEPVWCARRVRVLGAPRTVGRDHAHLRMRVADGGTEMDAVGFGLGQREVPEGELDIAFRVRENHYGGRPRLELHLKDFRRAGTDNHAPTNGCRTS